MLGAAWLALALVMLSGCNDDPGSTGRVVLSPAGDGAGHTHAPGQGHAEGPPIGDGTTPTAGGYRMVDATLPDDLGRPGEVSFRILGREGEPLRDYVAEQGQLLHLYVVRDDLSDFRHLHPALTEEGTWRGRVTLADPGDHRVVAEFLPAGADRAVVLGAHVTVPGETADEPVPTGEEAATGSDGILEVTALASGRTGDHGQLQLRVRTIDGEPVTIGTYLGAHAHVTGFEVTSGRFVHMHPLGAPEQTPDGSLLGFHTSFTEPGDYRLFVQVRVEDFLHQIPVTVTVTG